MNLKSALYILVIVAICSCTQENSAKHHATTENIEIYTVVVDESGAGQGKLLAKESVKYKGKNKPVWRKFYNTDKQPTREERFTYTSENLPTKSELYDTDNSLLSTYLHTNDNNLKRRTVSMRGVEEEILRIEEFDYNKNGDRITRTIMTAASVVDKVHSFEFDDYGNETKFTVTDGSGKLVYNKDYKISKRDSFNRWTEAWAFENEKPIQVKYRTFTTD